MSDRGEFNRRQMAKAVSAERWSTAELWDNVAFVQRWGTYAELEARARELGGLIEWWARRGPYVGQQDRTALEHLERAMERLTDLATTAEVVEHSLAEAGYFLDPKTRLVKELAAGRRGPKRTLLSETVVRVFEELTGPDGWLASNTAELRAEIARVMSDRFHPSLLGMESGAPIHSAINRVLNP